MKGRGRRTSFNRFAIDYLTMIAAVKFISLDRLVRANVCHVGHLRSGYWNVRRTAKQVRWLALPKSARRYEHGFSGR